MARVLDSVFGLTPERDWRPVLEAAAERMRAGVAPAD
jgi:hypothetical protein